MPEMLRRSFLWAALAAAAIARTEFTKLEAMNAYAWMRIGTLITGPKGKETSGRHRCYTFRRESEQAANTGEFEIADVL